MDTNEARWRNERNRRIRAKMFDIDRGVEVECASPEISVADSLGIRTNIVVSELPKQKFVNS